MRLGGHDPALFRRAFIRLSRLHGISFNGNRLNNTNYTAGIRFPRWWPARW